MGVDRRQAEKDQTVGEWSCSAAAYASCILGNSVTYGCVGAGRDGKRRVRRQNRSRRNGGVGPLSSFILDCRRLGMPWPAISHRQPL